MTAARTFVERTEKKTGADSKVSLKRIMVGTDFSPASDRALDYAISLARRFGSRIYLTHILTFEGHSMMEPELAPPNFKELRWLAEEGARKIMNSGRLFGVPYEVVIEEGTLWPAMEGLIQKYEIDLLVVATHGMGAIEKVLTGSVAEQIFRQARIPVLTVGPAAKEEPLFEAEFKDILFATDFGISSERAAAFAFALAQEHRARLTLLHVLPEGWECTGLEAVREKELVTHQLKELLPTGSQLLCKPEYHLAYGEPAKEILCVAQATRANLIVMGAKKRKGLAGHVPHTKAYKVVCEAKCPVLTIKS
jgi:nucleotide-binding universal stress UspA family protein